MSRENAKTDIVQMSQISNINEWGEYIRSTERVDMADDGVIQNIENNNPAITYVYASLTSEAIDWRAAERCIANSKYLKHLQLRCTAYKHSFCKDLALNKSLEILELQIGCRNDGGGLQLQQCCQGRWW